MNARSLLTAVLLALAPLPALAQAPNAIALVGTIDKVDATSLSLKGEQPGEVATFTLAGNLVVLQNKTITLADIKPGDYVASAAVRGSDGRLHSTELRIFPEAMRGIGEGQRPMNDPRSQIMTNAEVTGAAIVGSSNSLKVKLSSGEPELVVDPGVPVTRIDMASKALLAPGTKVRVQGTKTDAGATATRVTIL